MRRLMTLIILGLLLSTCVLVKNREATVLARGTGDTLESSNICLYDRMIFPDEGQPIDSKVHLNLFADGLTLGNAYWFGVMSALVYKPGEEWLEQLRNTLANRFPEGSSRRANLIEFVDLPAIDLDAENDPELVRILGNWFERLFADGQLFWAEGKDAAVVSFRGTESFEDIVTDAIAIKTARGKFSGKRFVPPGPGEAFGVEDQWEFEVETHIGFQKATNALMPKLYDLLSRSGSISYVIPSQDKPVVFHPQYMTLEGILDHLMTVQENDLQRVLGELPEGWNVPTPVKMAIVKNWRELRDTEKNVGEFHMDYEERNSVLSPIKGQWSHQPKRIWTTGHSLGGALATVFAFEMTRAGYFLGGLYTFGAPRAGNNGFIRELTLRSIRLGVKDNLVRVVNQNDIVPRVPPPLGIVSNPDSWKHLNGTRYLVGDDESPFGVRFWIRNEDVATMLPDAPQYIRGDGTPREEVARNQEVRGQQEAMARAQHFGMQSRAFLAELDRMFPRFISELDVRQLPQWITNHYMAGYIDGIGRYSFEGRTSLCNENPE